MTFHLRHDLRPGDLGAIVQFHGALYAREYGFDATFEAYVAGPLAQFVLHRSEGDRLWIAEGGGRLVGCVAIVGASAEPGDASGHPSSGPSAEGDAPPSQAQLRWFLVDPAVRGRGLGKRLLHEALSFCRSCGYESVFLWTVSALTAAAHLYRAAGFRKVEEKPGQWGVEVLEEKYLLELPVSQMPRRQEPQLS